MCAPTWRAVHSAAHSPAAIRSRVPMSMPVQRTSLLALFGRVTGATSGCLLSRLRGGSWSSRRAPIEMPRGGSRASRERPRLRKQSEVGAELEGVSDADGDATDVTLADDRVALRPWSRDDAGFMALAFADPAIRRYNGDHDRRGHPTPPLSTTQAESVVEQFALAWRTFTATGRPTGVAFAITDAKSGELVGCCGVDDWTKEDVAQLGYWIAAGARRRGYASRATILLTRWLFELGAARVFMTIVAGNEGSVAVAHRAGFGYEGTMRSHAIWQGKRRDVMWFAALPDEWPMRRPEEQV
jgi:RimJ/RimL family protein N-acetyltransferase